MIKKIKIKKYYTGKYDYRHKAYYTDISKKIDSRKVVVLTFLRFLVVNNQRKSVIRRADFTVQWHKDLLKNRRLYWLSLKSAQKYAVFKDLCKKKTIYGYVSVLYKRT